LPVDIEVEYVQRLRPLPTKLMTRQSGRIPHMTAPKERTILVVDDSPPTCLYLKRLLEKKGYAVQTAGDGATGARMAMEILPDLILLDKEMPGMHGFDVSRILRRHQDTAAFPS
jgi:CheY-like chemotaxis protein